MRMWMVEPKLMCRQHLLGEHFEIHKAIGNLNHSGKWTNALIAKGFLEPKNFKSRHDELVAEMLSRGFNHASPLQVNGFAKLDGHVDKRKSEKDLRHRCKLCFGGER